MIEYPAFAPCLIGLPALGCRDSDDKLWLDGVEAVFAARDGLVSSLARP